MHYVLLYHYVPDVLERRDPFRPAHLALLREMHQRGECLAAGAWTDPVDGAAIVFATREAADSSWHATPTWRTGW